jgi:glycyl-tRNA synthetase beta subunit
VTDDIATLREGIPDDYLGPNPNDPTAGEKWGPNPEVIAALDRVAARLAQAEQRPDNAKLAKAMERVARADRCEAAEARAEEAERERDEQFHNAVDAGERAMFAEARARELTDALERIAAVEPETGGTIFFELQRAMHEAQQIARAALAAHTKEPA